MAAESEERGRAWSPLQGLVDVANAVIEQGGVDAADVRDLEAVRAAVADALGRHQLRRQSYSDDALDAVTAAARRVVAVLGEREAGTAAPMINALLVAAGPLRLSDHGGRPWHLHVDPVELDWHAWFVSSSALALALALSERGRVVWGRCRARSCGRAFLDSGSGGPRQYCSATCASRTRVAELRARRRAPSAESGQRGG